MSPDQPSLPPSSEPAKRRSIVLFALLCVGTISGVIAYARYSRGPAVPPAATSVADSTQPLTAISARPHLLFSNLALGPDYGRLMGVALDAPDGPRHASPINSTRVYGAGNFGICLQASRGIFTTYQCVTFDRNFQPRSTLKLGGIPSRARVSRDGRMAAVTVFTAGHSYTQVGFSTQTTLYDLKTSTLLGDLEDFKVRRNGQLFKVVDFNFWGITFAADGDRYYATLSTGGKIFLVEGRVSLREMTLLKEGVECPSLSPDGTRLVFKSRTLTQAGRLVWRLRILNLNTHGEHFVNEVRSVDDQSEWLDDEHVLYALPRGVDGDGSSDVWLVRADGTGTPRIFVRDATSPCVVRPAAPSAANDNDRS